MKKILILLSVSTLGSSTMSNLNLATKTNLNSKNQKIKTLEDSTSSDLNKLDSWHNSLSSSQDKEAKQDYANAMNITTIKNDNGFDTYNITFNNSKLKNMENKGLLNNDAYNIISADSSSKRITKEANDIVNVDSNNSEYDSGKQERAFKNYFYIEDNKMHFIDNKYNNNFVTMDKATLVAEINATIHGWWEDGIITVQESNRFIDILNSYIMNGSSESIIARWWARFAQRAIANKIIPEISADIVEEVLLSIAEDLAFSTGVHKSKFIVLNCLENNFDTIKKDNATYSNGVQEDVDFYTGKIVPNSINSIADKNINDKKTTTEPIQDTSSSYDFMKTSINTFNFISNINYNNYDNLWEFLNSDANFNLGLVFRSYTGVFDNDYDYTFNKEQSVSILKPYLNNYKMLTYNSTKAHIYHSKAELDLKISNNPLNKTVYFDFKSTFTDCNEIESVGNIAYNDM